MGLNMINNIHEMRKKEKQDKLDKLKQRRTIMEENIKRKDELIKIESDIKVEKNMIKSLKPKGRISKLYDKIMGL